MPTFVTLFAGVSSVVFALSGTLQQFKNDKNPPFFLVERFAAVLELAGLALGPADGPGCVIDILLLVALPFRLLPGMLVFDSFERPPMLPLGSLAVAPLRPVDVGDGCILFEEDLDGT